MAMPRKRRTIPWLELRDKTYYVFWNDEQSGRVQRISLRTTDSVEAQQRYAAFLAQGHAITDPRPGGITVSQALTQYQTEHVDQNVLARPRALFAISHLKAFFGHTPLADIDIPASRAYAEARRRDEVTDSTIRRELGVLRAAANHTLKWRRITPDKMPSIELTPEAHQEAAWLTKDELRRVIETADGKLKAFIRIAYYTAGRRASVENLRKSQIDLRQGRINLRAPDETVIQRKSKKRRPIVPLFPEIRSLIERLMMDSRTEWLFGEPSGMYRPFRKHLTRLGLEHKAFPHVLRHSRATHLLQDGVSVYDVARC
jgi:integrase